MGACYSKSGHDIQKKSKEKKFSQRNGHCISNKNRKLVDDYKRIHVHRELSDTEYTEDSHDNQGPNLECCINRSQQTSLDRIAQDPLKNNAPVHTCENLVVCAVMDRPLSLVDLYDGGNAQNMLQGTLDSDSRQITLHGDQITSDIGHITADIGHITSDITSYGGQVTSDRCQITSDGGDITSDISHITLHGSQVTSDRGQVTLNRGLVSASDSGFVAESCDCFENADMRDKYVKNIKSLTENDACDELGTEVVPLLDKKCSCFCSEVKITGCNSLRTPMRHFSHNGIHGVCQCSSAYNECCNSFEESRDLISHVHRNSEYLVLQSSLKKGKSKTRKGKCLSWKSIDSLDWIDSISINFDKAKSFCSSILGDEISELNAPLATFDSVDFASGKNCALIQHVDENTKQKIELCSDKCHVDVSGLECGHTQSVASIDRLFKPRKQPESVTDLDNVKLVIHQQSFGTTIEQMAASLDNVTPQLEVMTMNGREVVVIDADIFSQIIDEIQHLRMTLDQLTEVIQ